MGVIKKSCIPLLVLLSATLASLHFGAGSAESFLLALFVALPSVLVFFWKVAAALAKERRSAGSWLISFFLIAVGLILAFFAVGDIGSYKFTK